jgi:hypothetical protein
MIDWASRLFIKHVSVGRLALRIALTCLAIYLLHSLLGSKVGVMPVSSRVRYTGEAIEESEENSPCNDIYTFDPRANKVLAALFPSKIAPVGLCLAYVSRYLTPRLTTISDALRDYDAKTRLSDKVVVPVSYGKDLLDSYWLDATTSNQRAHAFLSRPDFEQLMADVQALGDSDTACKSVLEKALFQRDINQGCAIFEKALRISFDLRDRTRARTALDLFTKLLNRLKLTPTEYIRLTQIRPKACNPKLFNPVCNFEITDSYLPFRVFALDPTWYEVPFPKMDSRHAQHFQHRSFIHIFWRLGAMSPDQMHAYWVRQFDKVGNYLLLRSDAIPLPDHSETLLIRSFGVLLTSDEFVDTGFPEEVLMRLMKNSQSRLDMATSDYRGTLIYQYKMSRRALLNNPSSLGLGRLVDDDPSFIGFNAEVPDSDNSYSDALATVRYNCINCHSMQLYGASTVFSMARRPE